MQDSGTMALTAEDGILPGERDDTRIPKRPGQFDFDGNSLDFAGLIIVNALLSMVTLGIYRFWAKTHIRRFLWRSVRFQGERFEYTGRGKELLIGFLIITAILLPVYLILSFLGQWLAQNGQEGAVVAVNLFTALAALFLIGVAMYRAQRYRLSRTRWRGIRFALTGSPSAYGLRFFGFTLLNMVTLGLVYPFMIVGLWRRIWAETTFGSEPFSCDAAGRALFGTFLLHALAMLVVTLVVGGGLFFVILGASGELEALTMAARYRLPPPESTGPVLAFGGLFSLWVGNIAALPVWVSFLGRKYRYLAAHTRIGGSHFVVDYTYGQLLGLAFGNLMWVIFTMGLLKPYTYFRTTRFMCAHMSLSDPLAADTILQSQQPVPGSGEGLADAFDVDGLGDF